MIPERVFTVPASSRLVGILSTPVAGLDRTKPTAVLLNAGVLHRVGPNRLHVRLARRLTARGFPALRLDLAGLGDSPARRDGLGFAEGAVHDVRAAMDALEPEVGGAGFVLMGICSGADQSLVTARRDPRVVGAVPIDGYAYRTVGYHVWHYLSRLHRPRHWRSRISRLVLAASGRGGTDRADPLENPYIRPFPPRDEARRDIQALLERDVRLFFVYTGGQEEYFNHGRQFREMFGASVADHPALRADFMPEADHTFTLRRHQDALLDAVDGWMVAQRWSPPTPLAASAELQPA